MKKWMLLLLLILPFCTAFAEEKPFLISRTEILPGMERAYGQGYEPQAEGNTMTIHLPIEVHADVRKIQVSLVPEDERLSPFAHQNMSVSYTVPQNGLVRGKMNLSLLPGRKNGDYACTVRVEGKKAGGAAVKAKCPLVIRIRGQKENAEHGKPAVTADAVLMAGQQTALHISVQNPNRTQHWQDMSVRVTDPAGDILTVGKNLLPVGDIPPLGLQKTDIPLSVSAKAAAQLHTLTIRLSYRSLDAEETWEESLTLPVGQEMKLKQGGIDMPGSVIQGDLAALSLPLMNMGVAEVRNVLATLTLSNMATPQSVLVGTIAAGETKTAKMSLRTQELPIGKAEGQLRVDFEDASGNKDSMTMPLALTVQEKLPTVLENADRTDKKETPLIVWLLGGGCGLLFLLLIVQGVVLKRKLHLMEEDRL